MVDKNKTQADQKLAIPQLLRIITLMVVGILVLILGTGIFGYFAVQKKVQGFAVDDRGSLIPAIPLDQPYLPDSRITGFVDECVRRSFSHDYLNYRITLSDAKECFTPRGAVDFEVAMGPMIREMEAKNYVMSVTLEPTVIKKVYKVNGVVIWETRTPMMLHRRGTRESANPVRFMVDSYVQRVSLDLSPRGVGLRSISLNTR